MDHLPIVFSRVIHRRKITARNERDLIPVTIVIGREQPTCLFVLLSIVLEREPADRPGQYEQDKQDSIALGQAYELLDAANQEFDNAQEDLIDRAKELARSQNHVIKKLESNEATRPAADVIAASRKMTGLMATAAKAGEAYLAEGRSLIAECERTAALYAGYPSIVAQNKTLVSSEIDSMSRSAKTNVATLKTWIAYMRSVDKEVEDGVEACKDKSDKGYMKNYNQVGPLLEAMLSGQ